VTTAVVTGATTGIGWAYARELAAHGLDLLLVARDAERLAARAQELREAYAVAADVLAVDLADREQLRQLELVLSDPALHVSWLVNNAGFGMGVPFGESAVEDEERALDVMARAVLVLTRASLPGMVERGSGVVVNVSSIAGFLRNGTYSAVKAWVTAFTQGLVPELRGTGVRVQALCPGLTRTEFHERSGQDVTRIPRVAWLSPEQVVRASVRDVARGRVVSVPGWQYAMIPPVARLLPLSLLLRMHR